MSKTQLASFSTSLQGSSWLLGDGNSCMAFRMELLSTLSGRSLTFFIVNNFKNIKSEKAALAIFFVVHELLSWQFFLYALLSGQFMLLYSALCFFLYLKFGRLCVCKDFKFSADVLVWQVEEQILLDSEHTLKDMIVSIFRSEVPYLWCPDL